MQTQLLDELKSAGDSGVSVKDLAVRLNIKQTNLHVWLFNNLKHIPEIKKIGRGKYAFNMVSSGDTSVPPRAS